jgi:class 3 adenylate cyclase/tetratricopeptide (TPR) repeat protein
MPDQRLIASFVPACVRAALAVPDVAPPLRLPMQGALLLADLSGFTPLAARLAPQGARGAEALTAALNGVLGALVDAVQAEGGEVLKFAGDALLAHFSGAPSPALHRAGACGLGLHAVAARAAAVAGVELALSVGLSAGAFEVLVLAGAPDRWEHLPVGAPLAAVALAGHHAKAGQTVVDAASAALLPPGAVVELAAPGATLLRALPATAPLLPAPAAERPDAPDDRLLPLLSAAVTGRLDEAGADWISELRRVSVIFLHLELAPDEAPLRLQAAFAALCAAVERVEGTVDKLTMDEKGLLAIAALGLPPRAHVDDPARAVAAALALREALRAAGWRPALGVATGLVFCGVVGSPRRREYTVIGDTVNLAARLMQRAEDGLLCDEATALACRGAHSFGPPLRLQLKGKAAPLLAFSPTGAPAPLPAADPVRGPELSQLRAALDPLLRGEGGLCLIEGAAGEGKSTLLRRLVAEARAAGATALLGGGDALDQAAPYGAWRPLIGALLSLPAQPDPSARATLLRARLEADPWALARAPLLAELLGLPLADTPLTAEMGGEVRAHNTQDLVVHLLRAAVEGPVARPLLLVLDDVHWLDSASLGLLRQVVRALPRALIVVAGRALPSEAAGLAALRPGGALHLRLRPLDLDGTAALLERLLGARPAPGLVAQIHARAEGNAFFTAELARDLLEAGAVIAAQGAADLRPDAPQELPANVQAAILARIDRLDPVGQLVVKVASVIGRSFAWPLLAAVHPVAAHQPALRDRCEALVQAELTEPEAPRPDPAWRYRHETTREVAYALLLFAQRRQLHAAVAEALAASAGASPPMARLAGHWTLAERPDRALPCWEAAGDEALRAGAYAEAVDAFARAAALAAAAGGLHPDRAAHHALQRGEALLGLGRLAESRAALQQAMGLLGFPTPTGGLRLGVDLLRGALRQVAATLRPPTPRQGAEAERHRKAAQAALRVIETNFFLAGPVETLASALRALNIAEAAGPSPELARASALFGWILSMIPLFGWADHYLARATALVEAPERAAARQPVRFFLGFTRTATGRFDEARAALGEAIALAEALGDKRRWIEAVCGICSPMHYQGDYEARVQLGKDVLYTAGWAANGPPLGGAGAPGRAEVPPRPAASGCARPACGRPRGACRTLSPGRIRRGRPAARRPQAGRRRRPRPGPRPRRPGPGCPTRSAAEGHLQRWPWCAGCL